MKEYSLVERVLMVLRVIVSIVSWVVLILIKIVRNLLPLGSQSGNKHLEEPTAHL